MKVRINEINGVPAVPAIQLGKTDQKTMAKTMETGEATPEDIRKARNILMPGEVGEGVKKDLMPLLKAGVLVEVDGVKDESTD